MRHQVFFLLISFLLVLACTPERAETHAEIEARRAERSEHEIEIVYPEWSGEIASAHLAAAVLSERLGYTVRLTPVEVDQMWQRVAAGEADVLLGAWLPVTHAHYYEEFGESLVDLGANLTGARIGLVVPTMSPGVRTDEAGQTGRALVTTESIEDLRTEAQRFSGRILGIESGAGVVAQTREAMEEYGLNQNFRLVERDENRMLAELMDRTNRNEWSVFTGWSPHWIFEHYSLRFLDDPKNVFGGEESIHTMVRHGLPEDEADAVAVLRRMSYSPRDLERLMRWIQTDDRNDPYAQAERWIHTHRSLVDAWVDGIE